MLQPTPHWVVQWSIAISLKTLPTSCQPTENHTLLAETILQGPNSNVVDFQGPLIWAHVPGRQPVLSCLPKPLHWSRNIVAVPGFVAIGISAAIREKVTTNSNIDDEIEVLVKRSHLWTVWPDVVAWKLAKLPETSLWWIDMSHLNKMRFM